MSKVRVPHAVGNVLLVDADGDRLVLEHAASCDGSRPRPVLARFDPADRQEQPIVELRQARGVRCRAALRRATRLVVLTPTP